MNQHYFIQVNGQQSGPYTISELYTKNILPDTLVWTEGQSNWTRAADTPSLQGFFSNKYPGAIPGDPYFGYVLAGRSDRFFAMIIESLILFIPLLVIMDGDIEFTDNPYSIESILFSAIIAAIMGAVFYSLWGGNLGHRIMGLKVISSKTGEIQKSAKAGAIREVLKSVFCLVLIPVIWLLWDKQKQNVYDKVVDTYVVKKKPD